MCVKCWYIQDDKPLMLPTDICLINNYGIDHIFSFNLGIKFIRSTKIHIRFNFQIETKYIKWC